MANNKLILLIFISIIFCQFNNIDITIELNRIDHIDKQIFENFDYNIKNYMQTNNFCPDCEDMEINIKCLFSIQKTKLQMDQIILILKTPSMMIYFLNLT